MTLFNEAQQEQLQEISANLRQVRQEKSIRLEEIAAKTHIRLVYLQAIEEERFQELPEPVFVQGFIRRYADTLGLDGTSLCKNLQINLFPPDSAQNSNNSHRNRYLYIPLFVPYILLLIAASLGLFSQLRTQGKAKLQTTNPDLVTIPQPTIKPSALTTTVLPTPNIKAISKSTLPLTSKVITTNVAVTLELQGESWLTVKADGKTEFEGTLTQGERKHWTGKKYVTIRSGNAGAVLVSVNNQKPQLLGYQGQVKEVTYTNN
ncbi:RodZ domain-containing protein [Cronbergia sp. UHCC 0137]|uniref:helix-turn-helix domain-containing protein n=1 Tax=Cronbergia sp. UHCC 0137 TaxID=3110239 RepID=UPI002B2146E6|nr:RodZ domain-containing protein [Cronbergia sp. UHCC 0137]MEA5618253.1 RodZ domain-containing protein [Cronbergia sp. UHCC 0137]